MWGILHILDYHYWHGPKKTPVRRKHGRGKHVRCWKNPKTISFDHYTDEVQEYSSSEASPLLVERETTETSSTNRITRKAQIKALIAREKLSRTGSQKTDPVHQLEPPENRVATINSDWRNPFIILQKSVDTAASRLQVPSVSKTPEELIADNNSTYPLPGTLNADEDAFSLENCDDSLNPSHVKPLNREVSCPQFRERVDFMEILKANEKLLEILQDPDVQNSHVQKTSKARVRLRRSGSFPSADCSHIRFVRPSTIEHKQKDIWAFPKGVNPPIANPAPRSTASKSLEDLKVSNHGVTSIDQETQFTTLETSRGLHKHKWHLSLTSPFKGLKKKIKYVLTERKRESDHESTNASLYRVPSGYKFSTDEEETSKKMKEITIHQDGVENPTSFQETNSFDDDLSRAQAPRIRRESSLKESLDGYARLFEHSFGKEVKWNQYQSKSLKLSSEDKSQPSGLKSFRRRLSLPDIESTYLIPIEPSSAELSSNMSTTTGMDYDANVKTEILNDLKSVSTPEVRKQFKRLDTVEETELQSNIEGRAGSMDNDECSGALMASINEGSAITSETKQDTMGPERGDQSSQRNKTGSAINSIREHEEQSPISVLETHFRDDITCQVEFPMSEGSELDPRHMCVDEPDSPVTLQDRSTGDTPEETRSFASHANAENASTVVGARFLHFELNRPEDDADFNYVRDVLEVSGFTGPELLGTWYSLEQPLSPTLFKALEAYLHKGLESSSEDVAYNCDHQLLFDLINEELLAIYESSLAYFPKLFSFTQRARPLPRGNNVVDEVWKRVSWHRRSASEMEQSIEDIVARDCEKGDGWMNLQLDAEDVALDLEDLIFDELVDEAVCSYIR
ncbi:PROTEIN TRM32 [Salix purpurea]|uniref:PROTEIN TRM32 n=2 Tax=Salix purpurea TaxID=77065 RepID=A0A9Q0PNX2_SALPP|nr:PROTEIN TRM32 [Salix purpurea]